MKFLTFLSILFFYSCTSSQEERRMDYEDIIAKNKNSSAEKIRELLKSVKMQNAEDLAVVYQVLLARQIASEADNANPQSERWLDSANLKAEHLGVPELEAWVYTETGYYYYTYYNYTRATSYFLKASRLLDMPAATQPIAATDVYKMNSFFWGTIGEKKKAIQYLKTALQFAPENSLDHTILLNSLGYLHSDLGQWDLAMEYHQQAMKMSIYLNDNENRSKSLGGMAIIEQRKGNFERAEKLWIEDIHYSEMVRSERNTMYARLQLGKLYLEQGKADKVLQTALLAQDYVDDRNYLLGFDRDITALLKSYYAMSGNDSLELAMRKKIDSIDEERHTKDSEFATNKILLETQREKMNWQIEAEKAKVEKASVYQWTLIIITGMLMILLILLTILSKRNQRIQRAGYEKQILAFQLEKARSEERLHKTNSTLSDYKNYLEEKNRQISSLEHTLEQMNRSSHANALTHKKGISELLESHLLTEENWLAFKQAFIMEEPEFYTYINDTFPDITESQIRIVLLKKIGLNNSQMSQLLGITVEGVKKSKQRIRKKYQSLQDFFSADYE